MFTLRTPVVFCTFNRFDSAMTVFSRIREARPGRLYLVSDAPRDFKPGEDKTVYGLRKTIEDSIDWNCELVKVYADKNMGCARRIASALDYVFEREDKAIILEDDCCPAHSFFEFCQTLLEKYEDDDRIMSIGGCPGIDYRPKEEVDYYFTTEFCCWGWATWRRSWKLFDYNMRDYPETIKEKRSYLKKLFRNRNAYWSYLAQWKQLYGSDNKSSWAYIFFYESIINEKLNVLPSVNLISNLGFDNNATNTKDTPDYVVTSIEEMSFPLRAPIEIVRNVKYDSLVYRNTLKAGWIMRIKELLGVDINKSIFDTKE